MNTSNNWFGIPPTTPYRMCDYILVERTVWDKSKPFDPKTTPLTDFWQKFQCSRCLRIKTETGYITESGDQIFGTAGSFLGCGEVFTP